MHEAIMGLMRKHRKLAPGEIEFGQDPWTALTGGVPLPLALKVGLDEARHALVPNVMINKPLPEGYGAPDQALGSRQPRASIYEASFDRVPLGPAARAAAFEPLANDYRDQGYRLFLPPEPLDAPRRRRR